MIEQFLIHDLADYLRKVLAEERLETPVDATPDAAPAGSLFKVEHDQKEITSQLVPIVVYEGFIPPKTTLEPDHPFVCVSPTAGTVDNGRTELQVTITVGVYAEDMKGYQDALHIYRALTTALVSLKNNRLGDKYERSTQMSWQWAQDRDDPYWSVNIDTTWWIYTNEPERDEWL